MPSGARAAQQPAPKTDAAPTAGPLVESALVQAIRLRGNGAFGDLLRAQHPNRQLTMSPRSSVPPLSVQRQSTAAQLATQQRNAAAVSLPADQNEALALARESKRHIDAATARLASTSDPRRRNVPAFVSQERVTLGALTPRHDSPLKRGSTLFFAGQMDYSDSVDLPPDATHRVDANRRHAHIYTRRADNVRESLSESLIGERVVQAVSELADLMSSRAQPDLFERYRAKFNSLWDTSQFASLSAIFDSSLNSWGPRNDKAREIFEYIYYHEPTIQRAYDNNRGGIRERIDTYYGPDSFNPTHSAALHRLRESFSMRAPVPDAAYPDFRAAVAKAVMLLDDADRNAVDHSNLWQALINAHVRTDKRRLDIRSLIRTPRGVPGARADSEAQVAATWDALIEYSAGTKWMRFEPGRSVVRYYGGAQRFSLRAVLPAGATNPGPTLYLKTRVKRSENVIADPGTFAPLLTDAGRTPSVAITVPAFEPTPANGDVLTFEAHLVSADRSTVLGTRTFEVRVLQEQKYTREQAIAQAQADEQYLADLLVRMKAMGGMPAAAAAAMTTSGNHKLTVRPITQRHDSRDYVTAVEGAPRPELIGYFIGTTYGDPPDTGNSFVRRPVSGVYGQSIAPGCILLNVTHDVVARLRRSEADLIKTLIHEAVHANDRLEFSPWGRYKAEFNAYWVDGEYEALDTAFDPGRTQGPKSRRPLYLVF